MSDSTLLILIAVAANIVLLVLGVVAYRLFRSDPNPTVSDPLGVPRVARVSGVIGTLGDGPATGTQPAVASLAQAATGRRVSGRQDNRTSPLGVAQVGAVPTAVEPDPRDARFDLPGLFAIDTGAADTGAVDAGVGT